MRVTRHIVQLVFLLLVIGVAFVFQGNCERWCPFGGVEAAYMYFTEGDMLCSLGVSNFFALGGVLASVLLVRRAFCGYVCPMGTISDWTGGLGRRLGIVQIRLPENVERILRVLKYFVLAAILVATWKAGELIFRGFDPWYALTSRHGTDITLWAYVALAVTVLSSLVFVLPFCRWLCPFAAVLTPLASAGLTRVKRDTQHCQGCERCSKKCPMSIPVHSLTEITTGRCLSCMSCLDVCPANNDHTEAALTWGPPRFLGHRWSQAALVGILLFCTSAAVAASYLFPAPSFARSRGARPKNVAQVTLQVANVNCRGRANFLVYFLERNDIYAVPGYLKLETWPGPGVVPVLVTFDPMQTDEQAIKQAVTKAHFDATRGRWTTSPFEIQNYRPSTINLQGLPMWRNGGLEGSRSTPGSSRNGK